MCWAILLFLHLVSIFAEGIDQYLLDHDFDGTASCCKEGKGKSKAPILSASPWHPALGFQGFAPYQADVELSPLQGPSVSSSHFSGNGVNEDTGMEMHGLQTHDQRERSLLPSLWPILGSLHGQKPPGNCRPSSWQTLDSNKAHYVPWKCAGLQQLGLAASPFSEPEAAATATISKATWVWARPSISTRPAGQGQRSGQRSWQTTQC